jgi:molecular chaperone GrpE
VAPTDEDLGDEAVPEVAHEEAAAAPEPEPVDEEQPVEQTEEVDLPTALEQRDEYLALARRVQADFENFRKRTIKQQQDQAAHATGRIVESLLPVLDACDSAVIHGVEGVAPIHRQLLDALQKAGLEIVPTDDVPFDPNVHEAVLHEAGDGGEPTIVECLRTGYTWNGRTLRAAMVKVKD